MTVDLYQPDQWHDYFIAVGGAAAALTGLVFRVGYFMRGQIGRAKNRWTWGQYAAFIPVEDFERLLALARDEGTVMASK